MTATVTMFEETGMFVMEATIEAFIWQRSDFKSNLQSVSWLSVVRGALDNV